jgi:hypothetical protein
MSSTTLPTVTSLTAATASGGTSNSYAATAGYVANNNPNGEYRVVCRGGGRMVAGQGTGTYGVPTGGQALVSTLTGTIYPIMLFKMSSTTFPTVNLIAPSFRVRANVFTNDTAPGVTYVFGLYPVTRPLSSGGSGLTIYTFGTVVANSTATFAILGADTLNTQTSNAATLIDGATYAVGLTINGTLPLNCHVHVTAEVVMHN